VWPRNFAENGCRLGRLEKEDRCEVELEKSTTDKIAMFCQVEPEQVIGVHKVSSTCHIPPLLKEQGLVELVGEILCLDPVPKAKVSVARGQAAWIEWKNLPCNKTVSLRECRLH
jgi:CTP synthase